MEMKARLSTPMNSAISSADMREARSWAFSGVSTP